MKTKIYYVVRSLRTWDSLLIAPFNIPIAPQPDHGIGFLRVFDNEEEAQKYDTDGAGLMILREVEKEAGDG